MKKLFIVVFLSTLFLLTGVSTEVIALSVRTLPTSTPTPVPTAATTIRRVITLIPTPTPTPAQVRRLELTIVPTAAPVIIERKLIPLNTPAPTIASSAPVVAGKILELDTDKIGQETWLNPQPEPPIPAMIIKKMDQVPVQITSDKQVILQKMEFTLAKNNIPLVGKITTETRGNKSLYLATINMPAKLFGLIPITLPEKIEVSDEEVVKTTEKPWYAKISREQVDLVSKLTALPNLVVKNIKFEPAQFKQGDKVNIIATIANEGLGLAFGFPDVIGNTGGPTEVLRWLDEGSMAYSWYPIIVYLEPGKTEERADFYVNSVKCGTNMSYEIAKSNVSHIEETTKEDNVIQFKLECNQ